MSVFFLQRFWRCYLQSAASGLHGSKITPVQRQAYRHTRKGTPSMPQIKQWDHNRATI
ncbi:MULTISPECIES: hypothetical protein [unclassified Gluconobacter]|uniref:hypothetical protein n=1 Tax=unclassified Gluconobacter TaxID=2644261 RepID=UPI001C053607|nr:MULTISPECIES: hypothetical protein [unclassified Gluconobacter]